MKKTRFSSFALALLMALVAVLGARAQESEQKPLYFENSGALNLAMARGGRATASANCTSSPGNVLHPTYGAEIRFQSNFGPAWWMLEFPKTLRVSGHRIGHSDAITSTGYVVKVSTKPLDEAGWKAVKPVFAWNGKLEIGHGDVVSWRFSSGSWKPVEARFVRVEWLGHNGSENGGAGQGDSNLSVTRMQFWGPDKQEITPMFSESQATWAGGRALWQTDKEGEMDAGQLVDDNAGADSGYGVVHSYLRAPGSPLDGAPDAPPIATPTRVISVLKHRSLVEAVGFSAIVEHGRAPRDVQIFTSPDEIGENWTLQKTLTDVPEGPYNETVLAQPTVAKRVRFDVGRVWARADDGSGMAQLVMSEVYVYGRAQQPDFHFNLAHDASVTATVYAGGKPIRTIFAVSALKAGEQGGEWDGLSDTGEKVAPGTYSLHLMINSGKYQNVGALGNNGTPIGPDGHMVSGPVSLAVDDKSAIYSANGWDEGGHDWKKWNPAGDSVLNSRFQIRNGTPNGLPYRIAVDEKYIYAAYYSHTDVGSQWIERFDRESGAAVKWDKAFATGLIQVYPKPEKPLDNPITDLVVLGETLFVGDNRANRVLKYDRNTGALLGEFPVPDIGAMAGRDGHLWIAQNGAITLFDADGKQEAQPITGLGKVADLSFDGHNHLLVADEKAGQVLTYDVNGQTVTRKGAFGRVAVPGDSAPDKFYHLGGVAAGTDGSFVTTNFLPIGGARMAKWTADGKLMWEKDGLEFTGNANYASDKPDSIVSTYFHRYQTDKKAASWKYDGSLYTGGNTSNGYWHGVPRWVKFGPHWFLFLPIGDGVQAYRLEGNSLKFASAIGGREPDSSGKEEPTLGQWTWTDADGDAQVQESEVNWFKKPGEGSYAIMSMNVDTRGNIVFANLSDNTIKMLPMQKLNARGNPEYDWAALKTMVPADTSASKFEPMTTVRTDNQRIYAFGKSKLFPPFGGAGPVWMGGWTLAKFDKTGKRLWIVRLAQHCVGMDVVPGRTVPGEKTHDPDGGVVCGYFAGGDLYHYSPEGVLIGTAAPDKSKVGFTGWLDNNSSVAANRDPRDGLIDVFTEENFSHRILWYRLDDSKITTQIMPIVRPNGAP